MKSRPQSKNWPRPLRRLLALALATGLAATALGSAAYAMTWRERDAMYFRAHHRHMVLPPGRHWDDPYVVVTAPPPVVYAAPPPPVVYAPPQPVAPPPLFGLGLSIRLH